VVGQTAMGLIIVSKKNLACVGKITVLGVSSPSALSVRVCLERGSVGRRTGDAKMWKGFHMVGDYFKRIKPARKFFS
jgi:hypothetical protein